MRLDMVFDHAAARAVVKRRTTDSEREPTRTNENERQRALIVVRWCLLSFADVRCRSLLVRRRNHLHPDTDVVTNGLGRFD